MRQISSSVGSAAIRSSWRWSRSSSPESRAPRRRSSPPSLREPSGADLGLAPLGTAPKRRSSRASVGRSSERGTIASTWPKRSFDSARPKSSGSFSRVVCCDDARAGERHQRARLGERDVAQAREAREHAAGGRVRHARRSTAARVVQLLDGARRSSAAASARGCPPACGHRPTPRPRPAARRGSTARVAGARELLAHDAAHRAAHEREVHDRELAPEALDRGAADDHRVAEAGCELGLRQALDVGSQVEERQRVGRAQVGCLLEKLPSSASCAIRSRALDREVVAALPADPERRRELVVAVVRAARRARVGMLLGLAAREPACSRSRRRSWSFQHRGSLDPALQAVAAGGHRPSAAANRASSRLVGRSRDAAEPGPTIASASRARRAASRPRRRSPSGSGMKRRAPPARPVEVERDVDAVDARRRRARSRLAGLDPARLDERDLRRVEIPRADERDVAAAHCLASITFAAASPRCCRTVTSRACSGRRGHRSRRRPATPRHSRAPRSRRRARSSSRPE